MKVSEFLFFRCLIGFTVIALIAVNPLSASAQDTEYTEKKLSRWKQTKDNDAVPTARQKVIADDISGVWRLGDGGGFDSAQIKL